MGVEVWRWAGGEGCKRGEEQVGVASEDSEDRESNS